MDEQGNAGHGNDPHPPVRGGHRDGQVGKHVAQICLHAGANDFGSIMIEENVVSAAGAPHRFTAKGIQAAIQESGFEPQLRDQQYRFRELPPQIEEQTINY